MLEDESDRARRDEAAARQREFKAIDTDWLRRPDQQLILLPKTTSALQARLVCPISLRNFLI